MENPNRQILMAKIRLEHWTSIDTGQDQSAVEAASKKIRASQKTIETYMIYHYLTRNFMEMSALFFFC